MKKWRKHGNYCARLKRLKVGIVIEEVLKPQQHRGQSSPAADQAASCPSRPAKPSPWQYVKKCHMKRHLAWQLDRKPNNKSNFGASVLVFCHLLLRQSGVEPQQQQHEQEHEQGEGGVEEGGGEHPRNQSSSNRLISQGPSNPQSILNNWIINCMMSIIQCWVRSEVVRL